MVMLPLGLPTALLAAIGVELSADQLGRLEFVLLLATVGATVGFVVNGVIKAFGGAE